MVELDSSIKPGGLALSQAPKCHQRHGRVHLGRTLYDDMERMEDIVRSSDLDWTIVHPPGLVSAPGRGYVSAPDEIQGALCAREDLAAMLLDQLAHNQTSHKVMAVATPGIRVSGIDMLRHEVLKRPS